MLQLRLTQKYAKDCKVTSLQAPSETSEPLNDWFIDILRIGRKKVAIVTHAKSLFTLLFPYSHVGGAQNVPKCIPILLQQFLSEGYNMKLIAELGPWVDASRYVFCKTQERRILGHMNDFKFCLQVKTQDCLFEMINDMPINVKSVGYTTANERLAQLLKCAHQY